MISLFTPRDAPVWLLPVLQSIERALRSLERLTRANELEVYTVADLPSASGPPRLIYVSNEAGGATLAFNDSVNWRRTSDRAVVS